MLAQPCFKRALVRVQKGVNKTSKGRLLEANWASFQIQKSISLISCYETFLQNVVWVTTKIHNDSFYTSRMMNIHAFNGRNERMGKKGCCRHYNNVKTLMTILYGKTFSGHQYFTINVKGGDPKVPLPDGIRINVYEN